MSESEAAPRAMLSLAGVALAFNCAVALVALLASWAIGGDDFKDSLHGDYAMPLLALGIAAGVALRRATLPSDRAPRILPS